MGKALSWPQHTQNVPQGQLRALPSWIKGIPLEQDLSTPRRFHRLAEGSSQLDKRDSARSGPQDTQKVPQGHPDKGALAAQGLSSSPEPEQGIVHPTKSQNSGGAEEF